MAVPSSVHSPNGRKLIPVLLFALEHPPTVEIQLLPREWMRCALRLGPSCVVSRFFDILMTDLVDDEDQIDIKAEGGPVLIGTELPFRLTPNLQDFITPIGIEGLLTASMLALGRGLTEPEVPSLFPYTFTHAIG